MDCLGFRTRAKSELLSSNCSRVADYFVILKISQRKKVLRRRYAVPPKKGKPRTDCFSARTAALSENPNTQLSFFARLFPSRCPLFLFSLPALSFLINAALINSILNARTYGSSAFAAALQVHNATRDEPRVQYTERKLNTRMTSVGTTIKTIHATRFE